MKAQLKQAHHCFDQASHHLMVLKLMGSDKPTLFSMFEAAIKTEDDALHYALSANKTELADLIYANRLFINFWFKRYDEAAEMAEKYQSNYRLHLNFADVIHAFYEGLTAFHLARCSDDREKWMNVGQSALKRYESITKHSVWNFENKMLLLEAERHFSRGEKDMAQQKYEASIESARRHRFVHEEGLAMELFGDFYKKTGNDNEAAGQIANARVCFEKWGAFGLLDHLSHQ